MRIGSDKDNSTSDGLADLIRENSEKDKTDLTGKRRRSSFGIIINGGSSAA